MTASTADDRSVDPHVDLYAHYAAGWIGAGGIRANMISSADGAASHDGKSGGLQTPGDNQIFSALRDLADVVLVGAGTARAEEYRPASPAGERLAARELYGLPRTLPIALVSRNLGLDPHAQVFGGVARTLVFTSASSDPAARDRLAEVADVIVVGDSTVDLASVRAALTERGLTHVLCEGGPSLLACISSRPGSLTSCV